MESSSFTGLRARTHSDPELPQLLPVPARPHSSYEPKVAPKSYTQFEPDVIEAMSVALGIDVESQTQFHWIVRDCLLALRDNGWLCTVSRPSPSVADLTYTNALSQEAKSYHPVVEEHRLLAERLMLEWKELEQKRKDRLYLIKELVYHQISGIKDVRKVSNPKVMERLLEYLGIDVLTESYLIRRVKQVLEGAYFTVKHLGGLHHVTVDTVVDVHALIVQLALERAAFMKKVSPSGLLYCIECETALGDVICGSCHDVFCNACMVAVHSTGHRLDHPAVLIEQCVCSECEVKSAAVRCVECADLYCSDCFHNTHKSGKRSRHCVRLPMTTFCFECDSNEASYICMQCEDVLCTECAARIHRKGARQNHTIFSLRKAAYSKKLFANNIDSLTMIIERNISLSQPLSPWMLFYDEALNPYWYNFRSRESVRCLANDVLHPPDDSDEDGAGVDLLDTRAAKRCAKGAVFYVPPPMHIKFASPSAVSDDLLASSMSTYTNDADVKDDLRGA
ncbi:hypothetical protein FOZ63_018939 [Perkinsus olseni]|uniref:B box-type domain-containing protein n=3 Tax=Perkinsus olseni TaxID=32597 RepID=A0A7J6SPZ6_PEROL|nr:hypothetical protein FOZ63_018939 [Perkinsus olseni]